MHRGAGYPFLHVMLVRSRTQVLTREQQWGWTQFLNTAASPVLPAAPSMVVFHQVIVAWSSSAKPRAADTHLPAWEVP